jgi:hypothetical protein
MLVELGSVCTAAAEGSAAVFADATFVPSGSVTAVLWSFQPITRLTLWRTRTLTATLPGAGRSRDQAQ